MSGRILHLGCLAVFACAGGSAVATDDSVQLPETCLLFSHFYGNGVDGMHLAWSADGLEWELLNNGKGTIIPSIGESALMRDPSVVRGPDGIFHMVWTTAWAGRTIGYASSPDLLNWSEQVLVPVMEHEPLAQNCWAPEIHYIPEEEHFLILWSTTLLGEFPETALSNRRQERNHRIYFTTTRDFRSFGPTALYYDGGFNVIDAALVPDGRGEWLMFVKHEAFSPVTEKNIRMIRALTWRGPFSAPSEPVSGDYWAEGPSAVWFNGRLHVYFDKHDLGRYGMVRTSDLSTWEDLSDRTSFPEHARHGTFLTVPRELIIDLMNASATKP